MYCAMENVLSYDWVAVEVKGGTKKRKDEDPVFTTTTPFEFSPDFFFG